MFKVRREKNIMKGNELSINFAARGVVQIDNARIIYRNFSGAPSKFNREGDRNFAVIIDDQEIADALLEQGWNVKIKPPREEGDDPFMFLPVKVKFNDRGPRVYLQHSLGGRDRVTLDEESVGVLDHVDIVNVDLDIRPFDWDVQGKTGRTAYLQSMCVTQEVDRFANRYAEQEYPEE